MDSNRKEFEAWVLSKNKSASLSICTEEEGFVFAVGEYKNELIQISWSAWKASRESLVVELPAIEKSQAWMSDYDDGCVYGRNCARDTIEYRLKAKGIHTK